MRGQSSIKARFSFDVLQLTLQRQPLYACSSATPQVLTKHVGVYSGLWGTAQTPRTVEVTLSAGRLVATIDHRTPPLPLVARSETLFESSEGLGYRFITDGSGPATHVMEIHVSGDYQYARRR